MSDMYRKTDLGYLVSGFNTKVTLVVYVGNEEHNYHKITSLSGDVESTVGWEPIALKGKDLGLLLPKGFQNHHKTLLNTQSVFDGHLESDSKRTVFVRKKHNHIVEVNLHISIMSFLNEGL